MDLSIVSKAVRYSGELDSDIVVVRTPSLSSSSTVSTPEMRWVNSADSLLSLDEPGDRISVLDLLDSYSVATQITKKLNTTIRKKGGEIKDMALRQRNRVKGREDLDKLKSQIIKQMEKLDRKLSNENVITATEKLTFSIGLLNVFFLGFVMGHRPRLFHRIYSMELLFLFPIRVYTYKRKEFQYYLADLCYFANALTLLFIYVFPYSERLFICCYALSFGTLSWAVITWRNSLVLHSLEKTTSTFIHLLPPVVFHTITHRLDLTYKAARFPGAVKLQQWKFVRGLVWTTIAYFIWQTMYHYFITVRRKDKIKAGRVTSFEFLRKAYSKTRLGKFVNSLPGALPVVAFTMIQFGYQLSTMLLCPLWYSSEFLSACFLTCIFLAASYNGATYYIDIFGKRFQKELIKLQNEVANWHANNPGSISGPPSAASSPVLMAVDPKDKPVST
jgi:hypothetical protein